MPRYLWLTCPDLSSRCRRADPVSSWAAPPTPAQLAVEGVGRALNARLGPDPGVTVGSLGALVREAAGRLRAVLDDDVIRACPWHVAREVVVEAGVAREPRLPRPRAA